jgi:sodium transport system permease protein
MKWNFVLTIYLKELKDSLRDRRTLISMIVIPTLIIPVLIFGVTTIMTRVMKQAQDEGTSVIIINGAGSPALVAALKADKKFRVVAPEGDYKQLISDKQVRVAVEIPPDFDASLKSGEPKTVMLYHYQGELKSGMGAGELDKFLRTLREKTVETRLTDRGLPSSLVKPFEIKWENVAPPEKVGGNAFGGFIPYLIIILCFTGAMYPAMDLTAGEKERGTMETLLCSPMSRINIVLGKFLMVLTASVTTIILSLLSMGVSAAIGIMSLGGASRAAAARAAGDTIPTIDPLGLLGVVAMVAPVAVLFAALLLAISLFAKSYKEAQSYVSPFLIVIIMPAMLATLPGIELNAKLALVPVLNLSLVCKEMLSGVWHWPFIALIFTSSCLYAVVALALCVKMFNREDVMFRV